MDIKDIEKKAQKFNSKILFDYELKKTNWFNIGGKTKIFFKPETLQELIDFLSYIMKEAKFLLLELDQIFYLMIIYLTEL